MKIALELTGVSIVVLFSMGLLHVFIERSLHLRFEGNLMIVVPIFMLTCMVISRHYLQRYTDKMSLLLYELFLLLPSFFIVSTAGDFVSVYLLSIFDPKFSLWGNIQGRFWGNNILSVVLLTFEFMLARAVLEPKNPLRIGKIPAPLIAGATIGIYIEILGATTNVWGAAPDPWRLLVGLIVWPGGMFALVVWILWVAQRKGK